VAWGSLAFLAEPWFVAAWQLAGAGAAVLAGRRASPGHRATAALGALVFPPLALVRAGRSPGLSLAAPALVAAMAVARLAATGFPAEVWLEALALAAGLLAGARREGGRPPPWVAGVVPAAAAAAVAGCVAGTITPRVVGPAPPPDTPAFWGFAALALAVALPMAALVRAAVLRAGRRVAPRRGRLRVAAGTVAVAAVVVGLVGIPVALHGAWLRRPVPLARDVIKEIEESDEPLRRVTVGTLATAAVATRALREGDRARCTAALEAARRAAATVEAAGGPAAATAAMDRARRELQDGDERAALASLERALHALEAHPQARLPLPPEPPALAGAPVLDGQGLPIGRVVGVGARCLALALDGGRGRVEWPAEALVAGGRPPLVAVPAFGPRAGERPPGGCDDGEA
jgi:hypothetical protein